MVAVPAYAPSSQIAREVLFQRLRGRASARDTKGWAEKEKLLLDSCHPFQRPLVEDTARRIVVLCSGRAGKTAGMRRRLLLRMLRKRGAKCLFIAKSAPAAEDLMWAPLKEAAEHLGIDARFREDRLRMALSKNGSTLRLVGADDTAEIDKLRGQPFDEVAIDEAASHNPERLQYLIEQAVGPRLGDYKGTLVLGGTPGSVLRGLFYDLTKPGTDRSILYADRHEHAGRGWSWHKWNMRQAAPYVQAIQNAYDEFLEMQKLNGWSDDHPAVKRERDGEWAADDTQMMFRYRPEVTAEMAEARPELEVGTPWNRWKPELDDLGIAILPPPKGSYHYSMGLDLGGGRTNTVGSEKRQESVKAAGDPTSIEIVAWDDGDPTHLLRHVYEFHSKERLHARLLAQLFLGEALNKDGPEGIFGRIGWPDSIAADIGALGGWALEELANVYGIAIEPWLANKYRHDAVEGMNGDLIDGRFLVIEGSVAEQQFTNLQWDIDRYGLLAKNKRQRDDAADAIIIARAKAFHLLSEALPEQKPGAPTPQEREQVPREFAEYATEEYFDEEGDWG